MVVAAFVGPGTVLTCASAGASYGYALGWVLVFSVAGAFVLQSLTAGTGILARQGLGEVFRTTAARPASRAVLFGLVIVGLWVGCAAFEAGNLIGAVAGMQTAFGLEGGRTGLTVGLVVVAGLLLTLDVAALTLVFQLLVGAMSLLFIVTVIVVPVDWGAALRGLLVPSIPPGGLVSVVALIGTTIVTYNLFLHASASKAYWTGEAPQRAWRRELAGMGLFLPLGGLISLAILFSGAALAGTGREASEVADFARLLEPVAGPAARYLFGLGLFAAGITSAITAPLAAAAGICELFGWPDRRRDGRYRGVWGSVLLAGLAFALTDLSPLAVIIAAQAANGVLLPFIAGFVLYLSFKQEAVALPRWYYALGALITLVCAGLGGRTLWLVWTRLVGG